MNIPDLSARESEIRGFIDFVYRNRPITDQEAREAGITSRELELQLLLHLPRLTSGGQLLNAEMLTSEARRLASIVQQRTLPYASWREEPMTVAPSLQDATFTAIGEPEARIIHERFHYLSSFRKNSLHFGLKSQTNEHPISLITLSPFDLNHIAVHLPEIDDVQLEAMVVSRVYSFDWAPRNATSYLMGQIYRWLRFNRPEVNMLITYINPNMGFSGASFRASNWLQFGREWGTRYTYLDGLYITDRELINRFGTADDVALHEQLGPKFETNKMWLAPLLLYVYFVNAHMAKRYTDDFDHDFRRS